MTFDSPKMFLIVAGLAKCWVLPGLGDRRGYVGSEGKTCSMYNLCLGVTSIEHQVK